MIKIKLKLDFIPNLEFEGTRGGIGVAKLSSSSQFSVLLLSAKN